jgi:hypothetical protein
VKHYYFNFNGIIQKTNKVLTSIVNARSEFDILKYLCFSLDKSNLNFFYENGNVFSLFKD